MEIYQLRGFVAVAEIGHLTRAAERLHVSQPALSAQIKALEDELEIELFDRVPGGMVLTAAGQPLLAHARSVLAAAQALRNAARRLKGEVAAHVRLGTLADPEIIRLSSFLTEVTHRHPHLEVELHHEVSGAAFEKVEAGALDCSFYYGPRSSSAIAAVPLREIVYRIAAPAAWRDRIEHEDGQAIALEPWIMTPPISTHHALATAFFDAYGVKPTKFIEADNEGVISFLVASGLGIGLMREDAALAAVEAGEVCLWNRARLPTMLQFIYPRAREDDPEIRALLEVLDRVWLEPEKASA